MTQVMRLITNRTIILFVFVAFCFLLLAVRVEINSNRISNFQKNQNYVGCVSGVAILNRFDRFVRGMRWVELRGTKLNSPTYDKAAVPTRLERAALYKDAFVPIPDCVR